MKPLWSGTAITGEPVHNAIVWQDRRTAGICASLKDAGHEPMVTQKTGLLLDPYFSGTKLKWILDQVPGARGRAERGELLFGTVDSFLIWRLTGGKVHATDATNAARTLLFNIRDNVWDDEILSILNIPKGMLPDVRDCAADYGVTRSDLFGHAIPILGVAGDQQAATIGQACFAPGYDEIHLRHRVLCASQYRRHACGKRARACLAPLLTGWAVRPPMRWKGPSSSPVRWFSGLRDGLKIIGDAKETQALAEAADAGQNVILVPAFTGLGAPYWNADCRGAVYGLTRNSGPAELARAALESVGYQTRDLLEAMRADWPGATDGILRVDGGMVASDWAMQFLSDIIGAPVDRPKITETTALGAAWLAGMQAGLYPDQAGFAESWALDRRFVPTMDAATRTSQVRSVGSVRCGPL